MKKIWMVVLLILILTTACNSKQEIKTDVTDMPEVSLSKANDKKQSSTMGDSNTNNQNITVQIDESLTGELNILTSHSQSCDFDNYVNYFQNKYPNVKIKEVHPEHDIDYDGIEDAISLLLSDEISADIIMLDNSEVHKYIEAGIINNLMNDANLKEELNNIELMDGIQEICTRDNFFFGVPVGISYVGLVVNKPLFEKLDIIIPNENWTYNDYYEIAKKSKQDINNDGQLDTYLMFSERRGFEFINIALGIDVRNDKILYNSPQFIDYMNKGKEIFDMGAFYNGGDDHEHSETLEELQNEQKNDNLLFGSIYNWDLHDYKTGTYENAIILPAPRAVIDGIHTNSLMMAISSKAKSKDLSLAFIEGFFNEEYQREYATEILIYKDKTKYTIMNRIDQSVEDWMVYVTSNTVPTVFLSELLNWMNVGLYSKLQSGKITMDECANLIQEEVANIFKR